MTDKVDELQTIASSGIPMTEPLSAAAEQALGQFVDVARDVLADMTAQVDVQGERLKALEGTTASAVDLEVLAAKVAERLRAQEGGAS